MIDGWESVSSLDPCDVCGKPDNCTRTIDRSKIFCGRVELGSVWQNDGGQFLHVLDESKTRSAGIDWLAQNPKPVVIEPKSQPKPQAKSTTTRGKDWQRSAETAFNFPSAGIGRKKLSELLGVSIESLERLEVGWAGIHRGWSFPERDATFQVIGINWRSTDGSKKRESGSRAGLTFDPKNWMESEFDTNAYLVEGGSDVTAMLTNGLCAVGRPSNRGGVELLAELLKAVPLDRQIMVIGERDQKLQSSLSASHQIKHKPDCSGCSICFPGWFGATRTAERLASMLGRPIAWTFPPGNAKDMRQWFNGVNGKADSES